MIHQATSQPARGLVQTFTLGAQQNRHRLNRRGRQDHKICLHGVTTAVDLINQHHAIGASFARGDHQAIHQMLGKQRNRPVFRARGNVLPRLLERGHGPSRSG